MNVPATVYRPSPIPLRGDDEGAEEFLDRLTVWIERELEAVQDAMARLPILPYTIDAPKAPFNGMLRYFGGQSNWKPGPTSGPYWYNNGFWYKIDMDLSTQYPHQ
jgi:hypothetical protein